MFKLNLEKAEEPEIKLLTSTGSQKKRESSRKAPASLTMLKPFTMFSSVTQSCLSLCNSMDCSTPGFPVHHQLPELAQTQVHQLNNAIQPSHPLLTLSSAFNLAQHQGLFQRVSSSHQVAKILGWMKHKQESRLPGEILIISDMQMTPPLWQKVKNYGASW